MARPAGEGLNDAVPIRLLLVDDHDILRYGVRALLRSQPGISVVGEAASVADAISQAQRLRPDVVLLDARLPDGSGVDACREILATDPRICVLFFSGQADRQSVLMTLMAGAQGYVSKDVDLPELVAAIRTVAGGGSVIDARVKADVLELLENASRFAAEDDEPREALSPQEERVMALVVEGKTNKEIAAAISLSDKTVKNYLYNAFQKLGVSRRAHAASIFDIARLERAGKRHLGPAKPGGTKPPDRQ